MSQVHIVIQGECLSSIAKKYGFKNWKTIYEHPENKNLKEKRSTPNILFPGDRIIIPDKSLKQVDLETNGKYKIKIKTQKIQFRIYLKDRKAQPIANKKYELMIDNRTFYGTTGSKGLIEREISEDADIGYLIVEINELPYGEKYSWKIKIGNLDPAEENSGIQARLNNLGFYCGTVDGIIGQKTKDALKAFQQSYNIEPTGEIDNTTKKKIEEIHDKKS